MASTGTQRINATSKFDKEKVASLYKELRDIITQNSTLPFKDVIYKIAQINVGSFYNYIYPGNQMGQVSLYTVENLSNYFGLPKEIFTTEEELTEEIREKLASKIKTDFGTSKTQQSANIAHSHMDKTLPTNSIVDVIKHISLHLNNENSIETLEEVVKLLEITLAISNNRLNNLIHLKNIKETLKEF